MKKKKLRNNKEVGHKIDDRDGEARRMRQRVWVKARSEEINNHLNKLGHTFDKQYKELRPV